MSSVYLFRGGEIFDFGCSLSHHSFFSRLPFFLHRGSDLAHFKLIKDFFASLQPQQQTPSGSIAIDVGANQGFFTYYLASLGYFDQVHAFEINQDNFMSLQHGRHYNNKVVSDRVLLYPVGISSTTGRLGMKGNAYEGYLAPDPNGSILSSTFDCFAHHTQLDLSKITFIKIDVEGFELSSLKGMKETLLRLPNIKALLIEVGPSRWSRASTTIDDGMDLFQGLLSQKVFSKSYILIRDRGPHSKTCPATVPGGVLSDSNPQIIYDSGGTLVKMYQIQKEEWKPLLEKMTTSNYDCNFWFANK
jgi:FkbM family methyltransferase